MSIRLHLSADVDALLAALRPALAEARSATRTQGAGIPRPVPVLVPSAQLADWLQVRLARDLGLSMGFEFLPPGEYFGRRFGDDAEARTLATSHVFWSPEHLRWRLLPIVDTVARQLGHDPARPLAPRDRFAFAELLARQFERYARHRPDWPARWAAGESAWPRGQAPLTAEARTDEAWERELWREIAAQPDAPPHPACLLSELAAAPEPAAVPGVEPAASDSPLFVVGAELLDPLLLRTLQVLARRGHAISLYVLLPSLGYLGDQTRRAALDLRLASARPDEAIAFGGHPLLAALGQQAVGTFFLLETLSPDYAEWPAPDDNAGLPADASLLRRLQADIRAQRTPPGAPAAGETGDGVAIGETPDLFATAAPGLAADPRPRLDAADRSLRIHSCHGPRRELEVLRDELLRAFAELPGLQPEEVLVAVTDFDVYASLAEGILRGGARPLPLRLTAVPEREANPVAVALLALLRLAPGRHAASEIVALLNLAAVHHHLDLVGEADTLARLAEAVRSSGLTHDLDVSARGDGDPAGTWRFALDRHLAGTWFGLAEDARDAAGAFVHPLAPDLHHADQARLRFVRWLVRLAGQLQDWRVEAPAAVWASRLGNAVDSLLLAPALDDHAAAVHRLLGELARVPADTPLDSGTLLDWLQPKLENATSLRTSMGGEILFGRLDQLHGLPCRVFALLGLQDGAFPRASRRPAWDLLAFRPERWDADPRTQDRQRFLDVLLTPSDRLILGASNRSLRTPHDGPLASCVEELLRAAAATVRPAEECASLEQQILVRHRIQPFATDYFAAGGSLPRSFDSASADIAAGLAAASSGHPRPFFDAAAHAPALSSAPAATGPVTLILEQLADFWKDPARAWLRAMQLDSPGGDADDAALDDAPLGLDGLQAYGVRDAALGARLAAADGKTVSSRLVADRALPPGALGALAWENRDREVVPLAADLASLGTRCAMVGIDLALGPGLRLTGEIQLGDAGTDAPWVLVHRAGRYEKQPRHQLEGFLHTLAAALHLERPVGARVCGLDQAGGRVLPAISPGEARLRLDALVTGYLQGRRAPLGYAPAANAAMLSALAKGDASAALAAARTAWNQEAGRFGPGGEGTTPWARLVWRDADPFAPPLDSEWLRWAGSVAAPLEEWWNVRPAA